MATARFPENASVEDKLGIELDRAKYWLIKLYRAKMREGWENEPTESEIMDSVCSFLWNRDLQPGLEDHESNVTEFIRDTEEECKHIGLY